LGECWQANKQRRVQAVQEQEVSARQPPISCAILRLILDVVSRAAAFSANPLARAQHRCAFSSLSVCSGEVYLAIFLSLWGHDTTCPERSRMDRALVRAVPPERASHTVICVVCIPDGLTGRSGAGRWQDFSLVFHRFWE